jgi:hypothetical protein
MLRGLLALSLSLVPSLALAADPACLEVEPGKRLGPIVLGTPKKDLANLKLKLTGDVQDAVRVGPYAVTLDYNDKVDGASVALGEEVRCLKIAGQEHPIDTTLERLALAVGGCGPVGLHESGSVIKCKGGLRITQSLRRLDVRVTVPEEEGEVCSAYVAPGVALYTAEGTTPVEPGPASIAVEPGRSYCLLGRALGAGFKAAEVADLGLVSCARTAAKGVTTIRCPQGVELELGGPKQTLRRIAAIKKQPLPTPPKP